jgi:pilus assembly protein CpaF
VDAIGVVEDEVRELVRRRGLDPAHDDVAIRRLVDDVIAEYDERTLTGGLPALVDRSGAARSVYDAVAGFGALQPYLDDPEIEEIWVNNPGRVFIARRGRSELTTTILAGEEVRDLVEKMLKTSGRRVDLSTPFVDPPRWQPAARGDPGHHEGALGREHSEVRAPGEFPRRAGRVGHRDHARGPFP